LGGIFVSYRRSDSQGEAGRLFDDLVQRFGEDKVFMDVAAIEAGRDFRKALEEGVTKCGVLLVVIGLEWLDARDERGVRRLSDPLDFVRIETAAALKRDIPVIPVLVRGAKMPSADQLPDELKDLAYRNCIELTHTRWRSDVQLLTDALCRLLGDATRTGTSAKGDKGTDRARSGSATEKATGSSELAGSARFDAEVLHRVSRELALRIGPISGIVVRRAAEHCDSIEALYLSVSEEIDSREEREKFLREGAVPLPSPIPKVTPTRTSPDTASGSEGNDAAPEISLPAAELQSTNRRKYVLLAGGVLLVLALVFVIRFGPWRGARRDTQAESSPQRTAVAESIPPHADGPSSAAEPPSRIEKPNPPPATRIGDETNIPSSERIHVPEEVLKSLLIKSVTPAYPILARQAKIQGTVVLDANISKRGTVETLTALSGPPLLIPAALEAVNQWRYKPYVVNGEPVAVNTQIVVNFTLKPG